MADFDPQPRVQLIGLLFKTAMPMLARALGPGAPPRPQEKEALLARLEEGAWSLGPEVYDGWDLPDWEDDVLELAPVRALLDAAVAAAASARPA